MIRPEQGVNIEKNDNWAVWVRGWELPIDLWTRVGLALGMGWMRDERRRTKRSSERYELFDVAERNEELLNLATIYRAAIKTAKSQNQIGAADSNREFIRTKNRSRESDISR